MRRDQGLANHLRRAADAIRIDPEEALEAFQRVRRRREVVRRGSAIGVALAIALLGLGIAWWIWPGGPAGVRPLGPTGASGAPAGPSGTIAYMVVTGNGTSSSLAAAEIGGTERMSLPAAGKFAVYPVWSPDGTMLAYASGSEVVAVVGVDGRGERVVSAWAAVHSLSWSPDGTRLLVTGHPASEEGVAGPEGFDVYSLATDGSDLRQLTRTTEYEHWASWSPDGRWIAFASDRDASAEEQAAFRRGEGFTGVSIFVMRADGSDLRRVLTAEEGEVLVPSSWTALG